MSKKKWNSAFFLHKQRRSAFKVRDFRKRTCGRLKKPAGGKSLPHWMCLRRGVRVASADSAKQGGGRRPSASGPWKRGSLEEWSVWGKSAAERNLCADIKIFIDGYFWGGSLLNIKRVFINSNRLFWRF